MITIEQPAELTLFVRRQKAQGKTIGFVPTMGALHAGHMKLIEASRKDCDLSICSIFVNPTQFNDPSDFSKYPKTLDRDRQMLEDAGADVLFIPAVSALYPSGTGHLENYDLGYLESTLEGRFRPGHFQGVCQVMRRLLLLVEPHMLFMGQKDYQQCLVIRRLLDLIRLSTILITCPTAREPDGLAMSSRNLRLDASQRAIAPALYQALTRAAAKLGKSPWETVQQEAIAFLEEQGFRPDYFELADAGTLRQPPAATANTVIVAAAFLGEVRLIDNLLSGPLRPASPRRR